MDDLQEALTRYMVRRDSLRKIRQQNGGLNSSQDRQSNYRLSPYHGSFTSKEDRKLEKTDYFSLKNSNGTLNSCTDNTENFFSLHDKYDKSIEKLSANDDPHAKPFELSNPRVWSKPCKNSVNAESKKSNKMDDSSSNIYNSIEDSNIYEEPPKLLKVREMNLEMPTKMIAELRNIEIAENRPFFETLPIDETRSSVTSLTEAIENLDKQIKNLEMREPVKSNFETKTLIENAERLYPVLNEIKFDSTGYTPRKNFFSQLQDYDDDDDDDENLNSHEKMMKRVSKNYEVFVDGKNLSNEENCVPKIEEKNLTSLKEPEKFRQDESSKDDELSMNKNKSEDDGLSYQETPRMSRKVPIMESTRKSSHSDSTKIKFPTPNRVDPNSISSIGICAVEEQSRPKNRGFSLNDPFNATLPYEVEHFLEEALGNEILNSTNVTYATGEIRDRTNSHFNTSELISHDRTPLHRRIINALKPPMTEPINNHSSKLNRSLEMYRSFSQRIKKRFRSSIRREENPLNVPNLPPVTRDTDKIRGLLQEVNMQQTLINQATKALNLCNTMKEFADSSERIESERLLLLAGLRKKSIVEEIKRITSPEENRYESSVCEQRGQITISEMKLNLRELINCEEEAEEMIDWFVVIISEGLKIWATRPISYDRNRDSNICFPDQISFPELTSNFKIHVEVYTMRVRKTSFNHEEKYRIRNPQGRSTSCPPCLNILVSPTKLLKKKEKGCTSPKIHQGHNAFRNQTTSFVLSGFVQLFLHDLTLSSPWPLMLVPDNSILQGTIDLNLACRLHLSVSHEGFVNDGDEVGGLLVWNRRWCVLKGHTLMYWNYPDDQETKEPLKIVDLINCQSSRITTVDRAICAKRRTLLFETTRPKISTDRNSMIVECKTKCTIVRNLMSLDSVKELMEWSSKLNHVIMALREWNVIPMKNDVQVSDL